MKLGNYNAKALAADCPVCGSSNLPYEVNVSGFDDVYCRYECIGDGPCEVCGGKGQVVVGYGAPGDNPLDTTVEECQECGGTGKRPCKAIYAADGERSSWEE